MIFQLGKNFSEYNETEYPNSIVPLLLSARGHMNPVHSFQLCLFKISLNVIFASASLKRSVPSSPRTKVAFCLNLFLRRGDFKPPNLQPNGSLLIGVRNVLQERINRLHWCGNKQYCVTFGKHRVRISVRIPDGLTEVPLCSLTFVPLYKCWGIPHNRWRPLYVIPSSSFIGRMLFCAT
jgi:hypothetical protein